MTPLQLSLCVHFWTVWRQLSRKAETCKITRTQLWFTICTSPLLFIDHNWRSHVKKIRMNLMPLEATVMPHISSFPTN